MSNSGISTWTRLLARRSEQCPVCRKARSTQSGLAFWLVTTFEAACPFCRAYEKVHGRKSHEPCPDAGPGPNKPATPAQP